MHPLPSPLPHVWPHAPITNHLIVSTPFPHGHYLVCPKPLSIYMSLIHTLYMYLPYVGTKACPALLLCDQLTKSLAYLESTQPQPYKYQHHPKPTSLDLGSFPPLPGTKQVSMYSHSWKTNWCDSGHHKNELKEKSYCGHWTKKPISTNWHCPQHPLGLLWISHTPDSLS